jgi:hypothetical protein
VTVAFLGTLVGVRSKSRRTELWEKGRSYGTLRVGSSRRLKEPPEKNGSPPYGVHGFAWIRSCALHQKLLLDD